MEITLKIMSLTIPVKLAKPVQLWWKVEGQEEVKKSSTVMLNHHKQTASLDIEFSICLEMDVDLNYRPVSAKFVSI